MILDKTYTHGSDKVGGPLVETEKPGHNLRHAVRHEGLYDKDDRNYGEIDELICVQLGGELREDCEIRC